MTTKKEQYHQVLKLLLQCDDDDLAALHKLHWSTLTTIYNQSGIGAFLIFQRTLSDKASSPSINIWWWWTSLGNLLWCPLTSGTRSIIIWRTSCITNDKAPRRHHRQSKKVEHPFRPRHLPHPPPPPIFPNSTSQQFEQRILFIPSIFQLSNHSII